MASIKRRIFEADKKVKYLEARLAEADNYAKANNLTGKTPAQVGFTKQLSDARKTYSDLLALKDKEKAKKKAGPLGTTVTEEDFIDSGFTISNKILQEFQNENPGVVMDKNFFSTGQGAGLLVYTGKTTGKIKSPTGGTYSQVKDATALKTSELNRFYTDANLKNKVLSAVRKLNPGADELDAWSTWQGAVDDAAKLYAGGSGLKITPEDLLVRQLAKQGKGAPYTGPETTLARTVYDSATVKSWVEKGLLESLRKTKLSPEDMADLEASIMEMTKKYNKTVVTDNRTGKRVIEEKPGFSQAQVEAKIKQFAQEKDPEAYERAKSLSFFDWATRLG